MTPNLIYDQSKQVALQGVIKELLKLSKEDQAGFLNHLSTMTVGLSPADRTGLSGWIKDEEESAMFDRCAAVYAAVEAAKAAGFPGAELLAQIRAVVKDPNWRPF